MGAALGQRQPTGVRQVHGVVRAGIRLDGQRFAMRRSEQQQLAELGTGLHGELLVAVTQGGQLPQALGGAMGQAGVQGVQFHRPHGTLGVEVELRWHHRAFPGGDAGIQRPELFGLGLHQQFVGLAGEAGQYEVWMIAQAERNRFIGQILHEAGYFQGRGVQAIRHCQCHVARPAGQHVGGLHAQLKLPGQERMVLLGAGAQHTPGPLGREAVDCVLAAALVQRQLVVGTRMAEPPVFHPIGEREQDGVAAACGHGVGGPRRIAVQNTAFGNAPSQAVETEFWPDFGAHAQLGIGQHIGSVALPARNNRFRGHTERHGFL